MGYSTLGMERSGTSNYGKRIEELAAGLEYCKSELDRLKDCGYMGTTTQNLNEDRPLVETSYSISSPTEMQIRQILIDFLMPTASGDVVKLPTGDLGRGRTTPE